MQRKSKRMSLTVAADLRAKVNRRNRLAAAEAAGDVEELSEQQKEELRGAFDMFLALICSAPP